MFGGASIVFIQKGIKMSGIILSSSVRQNLLSLQSTADLLATTQNRLATGKKVNTALDNPTNFFTAASLDNRSSDINNLLDGIGNGVQVLQAANTGITSLQKLVDSAKSVGNQVLQAAVGYSAKSSVTTAANAGATADDLRGAGAFTDATFTVASAATAAGVGASTDGTATGTVALQDASSTAVNAASTLDAAGGTDIDLSALDGLKLTVNGKDITFSSTATATSGSAAAGFTIGLGTATTSTIGDILSSIDAITGNTGTLSSVNGTGHLVLHTGTAADIDTTGSSAAVLTALGIGNVTRTAGSATTPQLAGTTKLSGSATASTTTLSAAFANNDTITVNSQTLTFKTSGATGANEINITDDVSALLAKIDGLSGGTGSSITGGKISLHTGTTSDLAISSSNATALAALGLGTGVTQARTGGGGGLDTLTLTIGATGSGTATSITFGDGTAGTVKSLNDLNDKLSANNLLATIASNGAITISTTNDAASATIGTIGGTAAGTGKAFAGLTPNVPVKDAAAQLVRANLISQYNNILDQITTTAQDASYNGINLLNADQLKLTFNETGTSTLNIQGVTFNSAGLNLSKLNVGTDFLDNASANNTLAALDKASSTLRIGASTFGSNLSIVQIRQDFSKNLINVLQTGSSNLTLADTNEEAANSQALSTRQSIAVSALALANQSQQSVLQLLR
jgi:flagellin-like hook-associated protein FlgL